MESYVFVYGTLKRGLVNHKRYLDPAEQTGKAEFIGTGLTACAEFHLVLNPDRSVPCLYRAHAEGYQVPGEIYRVDADVLRALDILEAVNEQYYVREEIPVSVVEGELKHQTVTCQAYIMPVKEELLKLKRIPEYTKVMHETYCSRTKTPSLEVLQCLYGEDVTNAVQSKLDDGMDFDDAWKAAVAT
uniref:Gamma-glutamylcyclotransferase family protein n=1 Tax=Peronospora matthiolae TaxID=2874970 RepID=A0AAV1UFV9_9STRA